jgi:cytochrome c-type protein NapB
VEETPIMKNLLKLAAAMTASCLTSLAFAADTTTSLRGIDVVAPDQAPEVKTYAGRRPGTETPVARTFSTQPPVIPHAVENFDEINLDGNQCMDCHSGATYQKKKAPKIGDSHFIDRQGNKLTEASASRYNCVQCHVPQVDAPPLVDNTFKGDAARKSVRKN